MTNFIGPFRSVRVPNLMGRPPGPAQPLSSWRSQQQPRSEPQRVKRCDLSCEATARLSRCAARHSQRRCEPRAPLEAAKPLARCGLACAKPCRGVEPRGRVFARRREVFGHLTRRLARGANVPMIASGLRWTRLCCRGGRRLGCLPRSLRVATSHSLRTYATSGVPYEWSYSRTADQN